MRAGVGRLLGDDRDGSARTAARDTVDRFYGPFAHFSRASSCFDPLVGQDQGVAAQDVVDVGALRGQHVDWAMLRAATAQVRVDLGAADDQPARFQAENQPFSA